MARKSETRAVEARASRNSCGGWFRDPVTHFSALLQLIITSARVRPEIAAMLSLAAGGGWHG
jgi:hypothetical protein